MALIDIPLAYFKPNETFEGSEKRPNAATIRVLYSRLEFTIGTIGTCLCM